MKLKLELDFEDLEINEGEITESLKQSIQTNIVYALKKEIDEKVLTSISAAVRTAIEAQMNDIIASKIKEVVEAGAIKKQYGSDAVTIQQYVEDVFGKSDIKRSIDRDIEQKCKMYVDEMKKTYDLNFASHIVKNMQANNLLKDDVATLLLKP